MDAMVWISGATFLMGSNRHYPEEAPARKGTVDGFWIDAWPVTNREFGAFVRKQNTRDDCYERTSPVGAFPANGYGLYDMIGNVSKVR